jgi:GST-like protein
MSRPGTGARQRGPLPRPTLLSTEPVTRARTFEQLFVHASGLSPAFGQAGYFRKMAPVGSSEHAIGRFGNEAQRQLGLLDRVLADREFVVGDDYSIADIAHFGWIWRRAFPELELTDTPNVARWYDNVLKRRAVATAIARVEALAAAGS